MVTAVAESLVTITAGVNECKISTFKYSLIFNTECLNTHTIDDSFSLKQVDKVAQDICSTMVSVWFI